MPHYVVEKISEALNSRRKPLNGSSILIAGLGYKRDIDDIRESPSLDVMGLAHARGARIAYSDPFVGTLEGKRWPGGIELRSQELTPVTLASYDCVVILTDHSSFDYGAIEASADIIVDTRNAIKNRRDGVFRLGSPDGTGRINTARERILASV